MSTDLQPRLDFALDAAREASELILSHYQSAGLRVDRKRDRSPVTAADRGAEELLRRRIAERFPEDGILGEEFGEVAGSNGLRWLLDPIDGTKSFIHGVPLFGTLIGLESSKWEVGSSPSEHPPSDHRPPITNRQILGVCRFPALDEVVFAADGLGAWWQQGEAEPQAARVSPVDDLAEALFCTTTITGWRQVGPAAAEWHAEATFERLCDAAGLVRSWGDCFGHALVATGRAEFMIDPQLNAWDAAALVPILREAGGAFVDWHGQESVRSGHGLSVNAALKDDVLALLR